MANQTPSAAQIFQPGSYRKRLVSQLRAALGRAHRRLQQSGNPPRPLEAVPPSRRPERAARAGYRRLGRLVHFRSRTPRAAVTSIDCVEIPNFLEIHRRLNSHADYRILDFYELPASRSAQFDFVPVSRSSLSPEASVAGLESLRAHHDNGDCRFFRYPSRQLAGNIAAGALNGVFTKQMSWAISWITGSDRR